MTDIELTPREFAVLEYLLCRRDEVVPKTEIMAHVWDTFYDGDPQHRRSLRRLPAPQD